MYVWRCLAGSWEYLHVYVSAACAIQTFLPVSCRRLPGTIVHALYMRRFLNLHSLAHLYLSVPVSLTHPRYDIKAMWMVPAVVGGVMISAQLVYAIDRKIDHKRQQLSGDSSSAMRAYLMSVSTATTSFMKAKIGAGLPRLNDSHGASKRHHILA